MPDPPSTGPPIRAENLEFLRKKAKATVRDARTRGSPIALAQAQLAIARQVGFASWAKLVDELRWRDETRRKHRLGSSTALKPGEKMSNEKSLNLGPIDQIGLSCTDLDEAQRFYCDVLGLRLAGDAPPMMKFFDCGGVNIIMFKGEKAAPASVIYFRVPGEAGLIEKKIATLKSIGVKVESDPHVIARNWNGCDVWLAFFRDPFGNLLALKSDVPV